MLLNRLGVKLIAIFLIGGLALVALGVFVFREGGLASKLTGVMVIGMGSAWALGGLVAVVIAVRAKLKSRHNRWLARNGIRGRGTVVAASSSLAINEAPLIELVFDLEVPGTAPRRVERKVLMAPFAVHRLERGLVLPVYVNPGDPEDLLVAW